MSLVLCLLSVWTEPVVSSVALSQISVGKPSIETFWPISLLTWLTTGSTILLILDRIRQARKDDKAPIFAAMDVMKKEIQEGMVRMEQNFARDITMNRREIDRDINGLGSRLADTEKEVSIALASNAEMAIRMTKSEVDRENIRREVTASRDQLIAESRHNRRAIVIARKQILRAIVDMNANKKPPHA